MVYTVSCIAKHTGTARILALQIDKPSTALIILAMPDGYINKTLILVTLHLLVCLLLNLL